MPQDQKNSLSESSYSLRQLPEIRLVYQSTQYKAK